MTKSERYRYYASREFGVLKRQVRERSGGVCERCATAPMDVAHHVTYERLGREKLEDMLALCEPCHRYVHGHDDYDPAARPKPQVERPAPDPSRAHRAFLSVVLQSDVPVLDACYIEDELFPPELQPAASSIISSGAVRVLARKLLEDSEPRFLRVFDELCESAAEKPSPMWGLYQHVRKPDPNADALNAYRRIVQSALMSRVRAEEEKFDTMNCGDPAGMEIAATISALNRCAKDCDNARTIQEVSQIYRRTKDTGRLLHGRPA